MSLFVPTKRGTLYARIHIPLALRSFFKGRTELWRSTKTTNPELAKVRAGRWKATAQTTFLTLKRYGTYMTKADIEIFIQRWLDTALDEAEVTQLMAGPVTDQGFSHREQGLAGYHDLLQERLMENRLEPMAEHVDELLTNAGLPAMDRDSLAFKQLCRRLLEAQLEYTTIQLNRLYGFYPAFRVARGELRTNPLPQSLSYAPGTPVTHTKRFSEVATLYREENPSRSERSGRQVQAELNRFITSIDDCPIGEITKDHCRAYKEQLLKSRHLTLWTVTKWISIISAIFRWAIRQGLVPDHFKNPMEGLAPSSKRAKEEAKPHRDYTDAELLAVFGSKAFAEQRYARPERYWMCLICLFSGCRREEPSQLNLSGIVEVDGIPCFHFAAEGKDQSQKTACSRRTIPIHSSLLTLGFLEYVNRLRTAGETRLFPTMKKGKSTFADAAGKWYARHLKRVGLTDKALVLHGLRHTFITRLADAGTSERVRQILTGHAAQGVHSRIYDHRERIKMSLLQEGLERLSYPEVLQALTNGQRKEAA